MATVDSASFLFELPDFVAEEDVLLLQNVLTALQEGVQVECETYKVDQLPTGYQIRATLAPTFELAHDDLLYLQSIAPARIERIAVVSTTTTTARCELVVRILDCKQRLMITSTVAFFSTTRKRKWRRVVDTKKET